MAWSPGAVSAASVTDRWDVRRRCENFRVLTVTGRLAPSRISAGERVPEATIDLVINMATVTFRVVPKKNRTYHVELVRPDGSRTIPGFRSEHEAQAWGIQAERMISAERSWLDMRFAGRQTNRPSGEH
jgi:hypothetical protein